MRKLIFLLALLACTSLFLLSSALAEDKTSPSSEGETSELSPEEIEKLKEAIKRGKLDGEEPPLKPGGPGRAPARTPLNPTGLEPEKSRLDEPPREKEIQK